jgi:uncharacterized cupredoxin-like copper-binding protein
MMVKKIASAAFVTLLAAASAHAAAPAQVIGVKLEDSTTDPVIEHMRIVLDRDVVKPGRVTLKTENLSKSLVHAVLIARDNGRSDLPYDARRDVVAERRAHSLGEVADLPAGKSGSLTLDLKPGKYVLFCNEPGHYKDGMVTHLTVAR